MSDEKKKLHVSDKASAIVLISVLSNEETVVAHDEHGQDEDTEVYLKSQQERSCKKQQCSNK